MNDVACDAYPRLRPLALPALFALDIKPRGTVLDPIIPEKGLVMLYAARGTGKTHVALGIAYAVATGGSFLKWQAPKPRRVLLVDGEMPASALRERLQGFAAAGGQAPDLLEVLAGDLIDGGVGNLAMGEVQAEVEALLDGVDLLILDNLASLTAVHRDDAVSWTPIQEWLLRLRRRGVSVLVVHHAGKSGDQRGTSRREDVLDTSINLRHSSDYQPREGARFEVHIEKCRGVLAEEARPFEARLETQEDRAVWLMRSIDNVEGPRVAALYNSGMSLRDIAAEIGISKSAVHRLMQKMREDAARDSSRGGAGTA
jgi:putative DNA primase/helicase